MLLTMTAVAKLMTAIQTMFFPLGIARTSQDERPSLGLQDAPGHPFLSRGELRPPIRLRRQPGDLLAIRPK